MKRGPFVDCEAKTICLQQTQRLQDDLSLTPRHVRSDPCFCGPPSSVLEEAVDGFMAQGGSGPRKLRTRDPSLPGISSDPLVVAPHRDVYKLANCLVITAGTLSVSSASWF